MYMGINMAVIYKMKLFSYRMFKDSELFFQDTLSTNEAVLCKNQMAAAFWKSSGSLT